MLALLQIPLFWTFPIPDKWRFGRVASVAEPGSVEIIRIRKSCHEVDAKLKSIKSQLCKLFRRHRIVALNLLLSEFTPVIATPNPHPPFPQKHTRTKTQRYCICPTQESHFCWIAVMSQFSVSPKVPLTISSASCAVASPRQFDDFFVDCQSFRC